MRKKHVTYPVAEEGLSMPPEAGKKPRKKPRKAAAPAPVAKKKPRRKMARRAPAPVPAPALEQERPRKATPRKTARKAPRATRRNPVAPGIEAAFYRLGQLAELEYVDEGGSQRCFRFNEPPLLCADDRSKLRVVYDAAQAAAKVPAHVKKLHDTFNGYPVRDVFSGVFGKKVPGTRPMGALRALTYLSDKCVDPVSCSSPGAYRHEFSEPLPKVLVNPAGLLLIEGGAYEIGRAGIVH